MGTFCLVKVRNVGSLNAVTIESGGMVGFEWSYQEKKKKLFLLLANLFECNDKNSCNLFGHLLFHNKKFSENLMELSFDGLTKSGYFSFVQVFKENLADTIVKCGRLINRRKCR